MLLSGAGGRETSGCPFGLGREHESSVAEPVFSPLLSSGLGSVTVPLSSQEGRTESSGYCQAFYCQLPRRPPGTDGHTHTQTHTHTDTHTHTHTCLSEAPLHHTSVVLVYFRVSLTVLTIFTFQLKVQKQPPSPCFTLTAGI